jgi:hypothetical protein
MRFLSRLVFLLVLAVPLVIAGVLYLAIDLEPSLRRAAEITPSNIKRAKQILDQNSPRHFRTAARQSIALSEQDLDVAVNYLAHFYADGSARLILNRHQAELAASLRPPRFPVIFYFNISAVLNSGSPLPQFEQLRIGRLPIPGFMADWLVVRLLPLFVYKDALDSAVRMIKETEIANGRIEIVYEVPADLQSKLPGVLVSADDQERLRIYQERLSLISNTAKVANVSLTELLVALFELAEIRSRQGNAVAENRSALLVLAFYVNDKPLAALMPAAEWPQPKPQTVTLNGRNDFSRHFIVSAALAAVAGTPLADAVGVYKELEDSRGGSGFSFNDMAANRAGTRFGEQAAANPEMAVKLQQRVSAGIREKDIMPATKDLPEFMPQAEFNRRYGGIDAPAYKRMMAEIERRVAGLGIYR